MTPTAPFTPEASAEVLRLYDPATPEQVSDMARHRKNAKGGFGRKIGSLAAYESVITGINVAAQPSLQLASGDQPPLKIKEGNRFTPEVIAKVLRLYHPSERMSNKAIAAEVSKGMDEQQGMRPKQVNRIIGKEQRRVRENAPLPQHLLDILHASRTS